MTKHRNKILALGCIGILIASFGTWHVAKAADSSIYVYPNQENKEVGDSFTISVKIDPSGQKVCVVEGKLNLSKLSCQKVKMGDGISSQLSPSCDDLSFMLGIQGCATSKKTLFTVTLKAENTGTGTASFTEVDVIGEGVPVSFVASTGTYEIATIAVAPTPSCECSNWGYWQSSICGGSTCPSTQRFQTQTRTCAPSACDIERKSRCIDDSSCVVVLESEEIEVKKEEVAGVETVVEEPIDELDKESQEPVEVEGESTSTQEDIVDTLSEGAPEDIILADISVSWWGQITEPTLLTVVTIFGLIVLVAIGVVVWWTLRKRREKS